MPTIKAKTVYLNKIKQLGCYDAWLSNVKTQWGTNSFCDPDKMYDAINLQKFINWSFEWSRSPEGHDYWSRIATSPP